MGDSFDLQCHEVLDEDCIESSISVGSQLHSSKEVSLSPNALPRSRKVFPVKGTKSKEKLNQQEKLPKQSTSCFEEEKGKRGCKRRRTESRVGKRKKNGGSIVAAPDEASDGEEFAMKVDYVDPIHTVLPTEIRFKIFGEFSTCQLLSLRLISRRWKNTIDSVAKLEVKLEGDADDFKGKCGLKMSSCTLVHFQDPSHRKLFRTTGVPVNVSIRNGICYVNFEELLLQWCNLTRLDLCWRTLVKNLLFGKSTVECSPALKKTEILPNLRCLRFEMLINDRLGQISKQRVLANVTTLASYHYPCLGHVNMVFVGYKELHTENRYMPVLLRLLSQHATTLTTIDFTLKYATHVPYPPAHPRHILFCVPQNLRNTKKKSFYSAMDSQLITTQLRKSCSGEEDSGWITMLKNTRRLEIAIMTRFLSWSIKHLDFFAPTIQEYAKYLRVVELMNVTMYDSGAHNTITLLDAKVFGQCSQLTELRIYRAPIIFHEDEIDPPMELINLHKLPTSLEEVTVDGLPVESIDILETINALKKLKSFHYFQSQVPRRNMLYTNGISWEVLQVIVKHQTLKYVKVHITNQGHFNLWFEDEFQRLAREYEWNTSGITPGYMNMHQITLTKA